MSTIYGYQLFKKKPEIKTHSDEFALDNNKNHEKNGMNIFKNFVKLNYDMISFFLFAFYFKTHSMYHLISKKQFENLGEGFVKEFFMFPGKKSFISIFLFSRNNIFLSTKHLKIIFFIFFKKIILDFKMIKFRKTIFDYSKEFTRCVYIKKFCLNLIEYHLEDSEKKRFDHFLIFIRINMKYSIAFLRATGYLNKKNEKSTDFSIYESDNSFFTCINYYYRKFSRSVNILYLSIGGIIYNTNLDNKMINDFLNKNNTMCFRNMNIISSVFNIYYKILIQKLVKIKNNFTEKTFFLLPESKNLLKIRILSENFYLINNGILSNEFALFHKKFIFFEKKNQCFTFKKNTSRYLYYMEKKLSEKLIVEHKLDQGNLFSEFKNF